MRLSQRDATFSRQFRMFPSRKRDPVNHCNSSARSELFLKPELDDAILLSL